MDPLYGQKALAEFSEYVVASLFEVAPSSSSSSSKRSPSNILREGIDTPPYTPPLDGHSSSLKREPPALIEFIAYALYRTRLPLSIVHQSLLLLSRLKQRYPSARGTSSSPHRLFLSALMLSAKISMDDTYSNKSWAIVGSNYFALKEVNQMERELFAFLGWNVVVQKEELDSFIAAAQLAFDNATSSASASSSRPPVLRAINAHTSPVHMSSPLATPPMSCPTSPQPSASTSSSRRVSPTPSTSSSRSSSTESTSKRQRRSSQQQSEEAAAASRHQQAKNAARALLRPHTYRHTSPVSSRGSSRASSATSSAIGSPAACFASHSVVHSPSGSSSSHRMHPYALRSSVATLQQQQQSHHQSSQTSSTSSSAFPSVTHSPTSPASAPLSAGPQTPISEVEGLHVHSSAVHQQKMVQPPMHSAGLTAAGELDFPEAAGYFAARSSVNAPAAAMQH